MRKGLEKTAPYLYILPMILVVGIVIIYPIIELFIGSLTSTGYDGKTTFVGLSNFKLVVADPLFKTAIINNRKLFLMVPVLTLVSLVLATLLSNRIRGWQFYRAIVFIPYILSITAVGIIFSYIMQYNGIFNTVLRAMGLDAWALDWLGSPKYAMGAVAFVIFWKQVGFGVILFLARIQSIDATLYEAAALDGASGLQQFIYVTIPQTVAIIEFYVVITLIEMLSWVFNYVYVMTAGGPAGSTYVLEFLIYKKAFGGGNYNIAQAVSVTVLLLAVIIIIFRQILAAKGDGTDE